MKRNLIVIGGPTASGKSDLSVDLALNINGEIISYDSMQCYKHMNIGTAKISEKEMKGIKHYGIDVLEPSEAFNITYFQNMAKDAMEKIYDNHKLPILVGGTGFYVDSIIYNTSFDSENDDTSIREELEHLLSQNGPQYLHDILKSIDEESALLIHPNNSKRVIRAIEFYKKTGKKISEHNKEEKQKQSPYNYIYFAINDDREALYKRIDKRVDTMISNGLIDEVKHLMENGLDNNCTSMQAIGYKEISLYLNNDISKEEAIELIKKESRHYAKRQLTWLRRCENITWVNRNELKDNKHMLEFMLNHLKTKSFI